MVKNALERILNRLRRCGGHRGADEHFDHGLAQTFEVNFAEQFIMENFERLYAALDGARTKRERFPGDGEMDINGFYGGDWQTWMEIAAYVEGRTCLEIGPGPCGALAGWWWVKRRIHVDPLIFAYRRISLERFGKTWYTDDQELHAEPAEHLLPDLVGAVDGAIVCRNALDHCADPMVVLDNIGAYARAGCYLLLWTDLWHLRGLDEGHRNITRDKEGFEARVRELGFEILYSFDHVRSDASTIEYGCRARKTRVASVLK